nr:MAG TPA: hypothetical protein [Caudoviricetes sp.]
MPKPKSNNWSFDVVLLQCIYWVVVIIKEIISFLVSISN